jgi:hypothetical protein
MHENMMQYIIIYKDETAICTEWFNVENSWSRSIRCVIDLATDRVTFDGETWVDIEKDCL